MDLGSSGEELVGGRAGRGELVEFMGGFLAGFAGTFGSGLVF